MLLLPVLLLAFAPAVSASPAPTATPELKTIVTVKTTPYCNALAQHFNSAFVPMLGNDRTLDHVNTQLLNIDTAFNGPDFVQNYVKAREQLGFDVKKLQDSMMAIQTQINQLRDAEKVAPDPQAASQVHLSAQELQRGYDKQKAISIDLFGLLQAMRDYNPVWGSHAINGQDQQSLMMPAEMKDIKSYLRFDGQRDIIRDAENKAVDIAYDIATNRCGSR